MHDIVNAGSVVRVYSVYILETLIRNDSVIVRENFIRQEEKNSKGGEGRGTPGTCCWTRYGF